MTSTELTFHFSLILLLLTYFSEPSRAAEDAAAPITPTAVRPAPSDVAPTPTNVDPKGTQAEAAADPANTGLTTATDNHPKTDDATNQGIAAPQDTSLPTLSRAGNTSTSMGFGYDAFRSGAPITTGPINDRYLVSPGDEIVVSIWGRIVETMNLTVTDEGYIELPDQGGRIMTNGVTLRELKPRIVEALSQIRAAYINATDPSKSKAFVDVRLGKLRPLAIHVLGEVNSPGIYSVTPGVANVINLLHNAGGVRRSGTLRDIRVRHIDGQTESIDLYDYLLKGDIDANKIRLVPGDSIMVPLKEKSVTIKGEVRRPNNYELIGTEGMRELIAFAGGFGSDAHLNQSQIRRNEINRGEVLLDIDLNDIAKPNGGNLPLSDGDTVTVAKNIQVRIKSVTVKGEGITRSGTYEWTPGMRLSDLIAKAGGLREYAYLDRIDLIRTEDDFKKKLNVLSLADLYQRGDQGKFVFRDNPEKNIMLREMDQVIILSAFGMSGKDKTVTLKGHVKNPGTINLAKDMTLDDLLFTYGGFQDSAFRKDTLLSMGHLYRKISGSVKRKIITFNLGNLLDSVPGINLDLEEGDIIEIYPTSQIDNPEYVVIDGMVHHPGRFEMVEGLTLEDLIVMAGGLKRDAFMYEAAITRTERKEKVDSNTPDDGVGFLREKYTVPVSSGELSKLPWEKRTKLMPFDNIVIRPMEGWMRAPVVKIMGEVQSSGAYNLTNSSTTLSAMLEQAGGLKSKALLEGITLERLDPIVEKSFVTDKGDQITKNDSYTEPYRKIAINAAAALANPGGKEDIVLQNGDKIFVPINPGTVEVRGAVKRPLTLQHVPGLMLTDYIGRCGGYLDKADPANTTVFAANDLAIINLISTGDRSKGKSKSAGKVNLPIPPGSIIEVPFMRETERMMTVEVKGAVVKPALIQHIEGAPLGYYLNLSGGFSADADFDHISVLLPNGGLLVKTGNQPFNPVIPGGSLVMVATKPETSTQLRQGPLNAPHNQEMENTKGGEAQP